MLQKGTFVSKNSYGDGFNMRGPSPGSSNEVSQLFVSSNFSRLFSLHIKGPYGNLRDLAVSRFVGIPLFYYDKNVCVDHQVVDESCPTHSRQHVHVNKCPQFNSNIGFVTQPSTPLVTHIDTPLDMSDSDAYLAAVSDILASGLPNYRGWRIPLPSVFNWKYIEKHIGSYHDGRLIDYLKFGFPLSIQDRSNIKNHATKNHHSAISYSHKIDSFLEKELQEGAIFGPFDEIPHPEFTWSPLMTRPKGKGRQVILDLSYGENSVNNTTSKEIFDETTFKLTLPSLDNLLPALQELGPDV